MYRIFLAISCLMILGLIHPSLAQNPPVKPNTETKTPPPDLNQQLKQALCVQDWKKSLIILDQMKKISPQYSGTIITYRQQIAILAKNNEIVPNWPTDCAAKSSESHKEIKTNP
jgi:hypothetical protein